MIVESPRGPLKLTASLPLKMGLNAPKRKLIYHQFSGAKGTTSHLDEVDLMLESCESILTPPHATPSRDSWASIAGDLGVFLSLKILIRIRKRFLGGFIQDESHKIDQGEGMLNSWILLVKKKPKHWNLMNFISNVTQCHQTMFGLGEIFFQNSPKTC